MTALFLFPLPQHPQELLRMCEWQLGAHTLCWWPGVPLIQTWPMASSEAIPLPFGVKICRATCPTSLAPSLLPQVGDASFWATILILWKGIVKYWNVLSEFWMTAFLSLYTIPLSFHQMYSFHIILYLLSFAVFFHLQYSTFSLSYLIFCSVTQCAPSLISLMWQVMWRQWSSMRCVG